MRIGVQGASGKTGSLVANAVNSSKDFELAGTFVAPNAPELGSLHVGTSLKYEVLNLDALKGVDFLIDVSSPEGLSANVSLLLKIPKPFLAMTTGFHETTRSSLEELSKKVPVCIASNTSVGIATLVSVLPKIKEALGSDFDIEIVEAHHRRKKDAPSGTALALLECVGQKASLISDRTSKNSPRTKNEIGVHSVRGGGVFGTHSVLFLSENEIVEVRHEALSRGTFADGALNLARRLYLKPPGLYTPKSLIFEG